MSTQTVSSSIVRRSGLMLPIVSASVSASASASVPPPDVAWPQAALGGLSEFGHGSAHLSGPPDARTGAVLDGLSERLPTYGGELTVRA